jgi:hypothetical protein
MSRKHFEKIAAVIAEIKDDGERRAVAITCGAAFSMACPRFDRSRFLAACKLCDP